MAALEREQFFETSSVQCEKEKYANTKEGSDATTQTIPAPRTADKFQELMVRVAMASASLYRPDNSQNMKHVPFWRYTQRIHRQWNCWFLFTLLWHRLREGPKTIQWQPMLIFSAVPGQPVQPISMAYEVPVKLTQVLSNIPREGIQQRSLKTKVEQQHGNIIDEATFEAILSTLVKKARITISGSLVQRLGIG